MMYRNTIHMLKPNLNKKVYYSEKIEQNTNQGGTLCVNNKSKVQKGAMETEKADKSRHAWILWFKRLNGSHEINTYVTFSITLSQSILKHRQRRSPTTTWPLQPDHRFVFTLGMISRLLGEHLALVTATLPEFLLCCSSAVVVCLFIWWRHPAFDCLTFVISCHMSLCPLLLESFDGTRLKN